MIHALASIAVIAAAGLAGPEPTENPPLLRGPSVSDTNVTGESSTFSSSAENPIQRMTSANPAVFRDAVLALRQAPEEIRPTPEQEAQIAAMLRRHQRADRAFFVRYGRELRQLNAGRRGSDRAAPDRANDAAPAAAPAPRGPNGLPDARTGADEPMTDRPMTDQPGTDRPMTDRPAPGAPLTPPGADSSEGQRLREIMALRPKAEDIERPIRALLTEPQRAWLDEKIETLSKERFERIAMDRYRRQAAGDLETLDNRLEQAMEKLPPRLKSYLESLPEEDRLAALQELRRRRGQPGAGDSRRRPDGPVTTTKAPPTIDEIDIPDPTKGG